MSWGYYDYNDAYDNEHILDDYETQPDTLVFDGPVRAVSRRGPIGVEWWGQQWVAVMERLGLGGRLQRGRRYARNGSVLTLEIGHGIAFAQVQGSYSTPYRAAIHIKPLSDKEWERALAGLAEQAIYAAKLLAGEMPGDIEAVFQDTGLSLFPQNESQIEFECSCPDWGDPCKHAAAIYYLVAEQLDADPFILFHLRGRSREAVLTTLRSLRGEDNAETPADVDTVSPQVAPLEADLEADLEGFWSGADANLVRSVPVRGDVPFVLRQLGNPPGSSGDDLRNIYRRIADESSLWLGLDDGTNE